MEQRWGFRQSTDVLVRLLAGRATIGTGRMLNISLSGAFLETRTSMLEAVPIELEAVSVPHGSGTNRLIGANIVRRTHAGAGIEWVFAPDENFNVSALLALLAGQRRRVPDGRSPARPQPPAAEAVPEPSALRPRIPVPQRDPALIDRWPHGPNRPDPIAPESRARAAAFRRHPPGA
jgi:hypothetical protein